jgi:transcriptional regulator with XRE-family HTH domain
MRSSKRQFPQILAALKAELKARGLRQRDVAEQLGVGLATVKRWLAGDGLTTEHLEDLCALAGVDLLDLIATAAQPLSTLIDRFTPHQEQTLAQNPQLFFIFFSLLNGWPTADCEAELDISAAHMIQLQQQLARLGLIDLRPDGRIRLLATRDITWRKNGPLAKYFAVTKTFTDFDPRRDHAVHMADFVRLSPAGVERVAALVAQLRGELHRIAEEDQKAEQQKEAALENIARQAAARQQKAIKQKDPAAAKNAGPGSVWHGILFLLRPLDMKNIRSALAKRTS